MSKLSTDFLDGIKKYWLFVSLIFLTGGSWTDISWMKSDFEKIQPKIEKIAILEYKMSSIEGDVKSMNNNIQEIRNIMEQALMEKYSEELKPRRGR